MLYTADISIITLADHLSWDGHWPGEGLLKGDDCQKGYAQEDFVEGIVVHMEMTGDEGGILIRPC